MLSRERRIPRDYFKKHMARARYYQSSHLFLRVTTVSEKPSRFSFSATKKLLKSAVDRNRFRRRGYGAIENLLDKIKPGFLCSFSAKNGVDALSSKILKTEIIKLLAECGALDKKITIIKNPLTN